MDQLKTQKFGDDLAIFSETKELSIQPVTQTAIHNIVLVIVTKLTLNNTDGAIVYVVGQTDQTDDATKIKIKMVNDVFTKLTDIKDQEKSAVGSQYLKDELATQIFKIDVPEQQDN